MDTKIQRKIYKYTAVFEPDIKEGGYSVTIPALPGCISEGNTFEEALDNIKEAASLYLEEMRDSVEEINEEKEGVVVAPIRIKI